MRCDLALGACAVGDVLEDAQEAVEPVVAAFLDGQGGTDVACLAVGEREAMLEHLCLAAVAQRCDGSLDACAIVRVRGCQDVLEVRLDRARLIAEDAEQVVRPDQLAGREIVLPAAGLHDPLGPRPQGLATDVLLGGHGRPERSLAGV